MAKISALPLLADPIGTETVPVVDAAGTTRRARIDKLAVAAAAPVIDSLEKNCSPIAIGGDLATGTPDYAGRWLIAPPADAVAPVQDPSLLRLGAQRAITLKPGERAAIECVHSPRRIAGDFVLASVVIRRTAGAVWPAKSGATEFLTLGNVASDGLQQGFVDSVPADVRRIEAIDADTRRYVLGGQLTITDVASSYLFVTNTSAAPIVVAALAIGASARYHTDLDYRDFDPAGAAATARRLLDVRGIAPIRIGGNIPGGSLRGGASWLVPPTLIVATAPALVAAGIEFEVLADDATPGAYPTIALDPAWRYGNGDHVVGSVIVRKLPADDWSALVGDWLTVPTILRDGSQPQAAAASNGAIVRYETLAADIRRYWIVMRYTALTAPIDKLIVFPKAPAGHRLYFSGFAVGLSHVPATDIDWTDWDPLGVGALDDRMVAIETGGIGVDDPELLIQSSYHLVEGRPLRIFRDGLTAKRERTPFDIAALGQADERVGEEWAAPMMRLDGREFRGPGVFRAKLRGTDRSDFFEAATTFHASPAAKTGSPRILQIGDSLTNNGLLTALRGKLIAAGVTPQFVGTVTDAGGTLGEGRPNWMATNFTGEQAKPNHPGRGMIYDIFGLRPDGGAGLTIEVDMAAGIVTAARSVGGTGYPDGDWDVVFQNQSDNGAGTRRARGTIRVAGGIPGAITVTDVGAGYVGAVSATIAASISEYRAMDASGSYGPRWHYNPLARPATPAEVAAADPRIRRGRIADFAWYVTHFLGGTLPDQVVICLGMNDLWGGGGTPLSAFAAIRDLVTAVRAASATLPIAIAIPGQADSTIWAAFVDLTRRLMGEYRGREASNVYLLPLFQVTDAKFVFPVAGGAPDARTGQRAVQIADPTHPDAIGRSQQAEMLFAWSMCRLP